jgi:formamidopyrimidine-DNA glycosylase
MPELPEVETVVQGLAKALRGKSISSVVLHRAGVRFPFPKELGKLRGVKISGVARRAKYILVSLNDGRTMVVHLGMSGRMTVAKNPALEKHDHMVLKLSDGKSVTFNDARRFGVVDLAETKELAGHKLFRHLGVEPFDEVFSGAYLAAKFRNKKTAVKLAIMDQRLVVGVGNIYAAEALYAARLDPRRAAGDLSAKDCARLATAVRETLARAIEAGGSSLRDYVGADGELGYFQHHWAVYGRKGEACPKCKKACIVKITQGGRSTFYCPVRQK